MEIAGNNKVFFTFTICFDFTVHSPTFTTGKIRRMFTIFDSSSKKLVKALKTDLERKNSSSSVEIRPFLQKVTLGEKMRITYTKPFDSMSIKTKEKHKLYGCPFVLNCLQTS